MKNKKGNKGLKVEHDIKDINEVEQYIMTVKDKNILDDNEDDDEINDDILENQELKEKRMTEFKVSKKKKVRIYNINYIK